MLSDFTDYNSDLSDLAAELKDTPTKLTIVYSPVYDEYLEQIARSFMSSGDIYMGAEDLGYKGIDSEYEEGGDMGDLCYYIHLREENILDILQDMLIPKEEVQVLHSPDLYFYLRELTKEDYAWFFDKIKKESPYREVFWGAGNCFVANIDNLKRVANYILLLRFINNYIFTGKDTQMKTHINTMASAITGVMGMPQTMKAVQVLIRMAISYGESLLELHTLFSGGEVPLIKDKTTWNLTLKTMAEQLRNKQIVKKGKKNISYKDYLKLFLLTKGNSRTVCYRMMDIMQENIASKEPGFLMENCLFSYSWKGSLAAGGVKLNFVKQCSY